MSPSSPAPRPPRKRRRRGGVAILVHNLDTTGGMERQAAALAQAFARAGRPVVIVTTWRPEGFGLAPSGYPPWPERREDGVLVYRVPSFAWWDYPLVLAFYELVASLVVGRHSPAIETLYAVQGHTGGVHAAAVGEALGLPTVLKLVSSGPLGDLAFVRRDGALDRILALDRVVPLNAEVRAECLAAGLPEVRLASIPNGIDVARLDGVRPAPLPELGPAEGRELVVAVGRLDPAKRVEDLLLAFAEVAARRPRARLALVGDGPSRASLEARARALGLGAERVSFTGARSDVPQVLAAASAFSLPSSQEGLSNALLEAMAARVPLVVSDIAGNRVAVQDGVEGLLHPVGDVPALARALERVLADRALAGKLARAARARVEAEFSIARVARRYLDLFDALPRRAPVPVALVAAAALASLVALLARLSFDVLRHAVKRLVSPLRGDA